MKPEQGYEWPCFLRVAHGRHEFYSDGMLEQCEGVKAHPKTMIGRSG